MIQAYLDNSATTQVCAEAVAAMCETMEQDYGNPSSAHAAGIAAAARLETARAQVAERLRCGASEVYFTSGGTESNNLAILGAAHTMRRYGKRIVSTAIEHPSADEALNRLAQEGYEVIRLAPDRSGRVPQTELARAINGNTILVSVMSVNNETGALQPVESVKRILQSRRSPALLHCDAVQSFGKLALRPAALGIDLMSISAHKIHGPKGVGALYLKKGVRIPNRHFGGSQERGLRPGTEPLPAIAGFGAAVQALPDEAAALAEMTALRDFLLEGLRRIGGIAVHSPPDALPYITNFSVPGKNGNNLVNFLSERGACVSTGSACSKGKPSRVLRAMGLEKNMLDSALRVSFSHRSTKTEVELLLDALAAAKNTLRNI